MVYRPIPQEVKALSLQLVRDGKATVAYLDAQGIVSASTFYRYLKHPQVPRKSSGRPRLLHHTAIEFLQELILRQPDLYLDEIGAILVQTVGKKVSLSTVHRSLKRAGITLKRAHRIAQERSETRRREYVLRIGAYEAQQLVFADETSYDARDAARIRARSTRGTDAPVRRRYIRGGRLSCIAGLSSFGMLAPWAVKGSFNADKFCSWLETELLPVMQPFPSPSSVLVVDNASIHRSAQVKELVEARGCKLEFLSPYSPDYNPIERAHAKIKAIIRRERAADVHANVFYEAVGNITPENCRAWMRLAGYF